MRILLAGASGMIGTAVISALRARGDHVTLLVRRPPRGSSEIEWDPANGVVPPEALDGIDAVIGLSGSPIGKLPWTKSTRAEILNSRVKATRTLARAVRAAHDAGSGPAVYINASGVNAYGNSRPDDCLDELTPIPAEGGGFLCDVVRQWEAAAREAEGPGVRVAMLRTGMVTGRGGAFDKLELLARWGVAGPIDEGEGAWPWISLRDEVGAILYILDTDVSGPVNLVGPTPATSGEVMRAVARSVKRPYWLPAPPWAVKTALGSAAEELVLIDLLVLPDKLLESGYTFFTPTIEDALGV
ncbi:epimerase [Nocardioides baekrokdamisoli]|uniref:Epimerase n=1 Tax=Nocardioides baekrokdamisoli TaxID=1804624 RepID=A0A3G9IDH8_9ACTN|nr:TIGR01777 family oxidoreductase [Nocardioides baekrokdamisoli]BBH17007.1 epimerase [Nocardioides baekrokdamisoli]